MRKIIVMAAGLLVAGCQHAATIASEQERAGDLPGNYRQVLVEHVRQTFKDPDSVKDASISKPFVINSVPFGKRIVVCIMSNAKNSFGAYGGRTPTSYQFKDGKIWNGDEKYAAMMCDGAHYEPFPEIEGRRVAGR